MKITHAPDMKLGALAYHDPVYDESGGQGTAIGTIIQADKPADPTLLIVLGILLLVFLFQEE